MVAPINEDRVSMFWDEHQLHEKVEFHGLFTGVRTHIKIRYLCCIGLEVESPLWNNFRKKIVAGNFCCGSCSKKKSVEDWQKDFEEAIALCPGLFLEWSVFKDRSGEIVLKTTCSCGNTRERPAHRQSLYAVRKGYSLCRDCATDARAAALMLNPEEIRQELAKLPGYKLLEIKAIERSEERGCWMVSGKCLRNGCGGPVFQIYNNMKWSLAAGYTGCEKCALEIRAENQRITPDGVLAYAARNGLAGCYKNIEITATDEGSWIEADCNIGECKGHISTTWDSARGCISGNRTTCCSDCAQRSRENLGATKEELEELAKEFEVAGQIRIIEMLMQNIGRNRKNGEPAREKAAKVQCMVHHNEPPFVRLVGDLVKSWRDHHTNGCPICGRIANGESHRNDIDELNKFIKEKAIGPSLKILDIWYEKGVGHALCLCLYQDCNNRYRKQLGTIKDRLPKGSNGCPACWTARSSIGEVMVSKLLDSLNPRPRGINKPWVPRELWPSGHMRLDFQVCEYVIIEVHGLQHYEYIPHLHNNNPENFMRQQRRDAWKRIGLPKNGFLYLEIDMREAGGVGMLAAALRRLALETAEKHKGHPGSHVLLRIAELCTSRTDIATIDDQVRHVMAGEQLELDA